MGLEKELESKYDGKLVPAFYVIDLVNIDFKENKAQLYGRVFASAPAFSEARSPLDNFSFVFYDLKALLLAFPSNIETDAYTWLKSLPELSGATEKEPITNISVAKLK